MRDTVFGEKAQSENAWFSAALTIQQLRNGTLGTHSQPPQILNLSGIGPLDELGTLGVFATNGRTSQTSADLTGVILSRMSYASGHYK